jgi:hypothetical protein
MNFAFKDAKSFIIKPSSMFSNISLLIEKVAKSFNISCDIKDLK